MAVKKPRNSFGNRKIAKNGRGNPGARIPSVLDGNVQPKEHKRKSLVGRNRKKGVRKRKTLKGGEK